MNTERKYRKPLNRNGWMAKLQRICLGKTPNFVGYCPFFWLTWICVLFFPVFMIARGVGFLFWGITCVIRHIPISPSRPSDARLLAFYLHYLETVQAIGLEHSLDWEHANNKKAYGKILKWIAVTPDWENCALQVKYKSEQRAIKLEANQDKNAARAKQASKYAGLIAKPILGLVALFVSYWVIKAFVFVFSKITWPGTIGVLELAGVIVGVFLMGYLIVALILATVKYFRSCPKCTDKIGFFGKIGNALSSGAEFLVETIETIYTRECPLIEWTDETEPIQKR